MKLFFLFVLLHIVLQYFNQILIKLNARLIVPLYFGISVLCMRYEIKLLQFHLCTTLEQTKYNNNNNYTRSAYIETMCNVSHIYTK